MGVHNIRKFPLTENQTDTGASSVVVQKADPFTTFQAIGTTSTGTGAATVKIEVSNDNSNWMTLGTITLTLGTSATSDGFASNAAWVYYRSNVTALSGTGKSVSVYMGAGA